MLRAFILMVALTVLPDASAAMDPEIAAELERWGTGSASDARKAAAQLQDLVFDAAEASCAEQQEVARGRCELSRLTQILDSDGILLEQCDALSDGDSVVDCIISGAEALPIVAALGGDPRKDIDWANALDSYMRLREALKDSARRRCASSHGAIEAECVVAEQAILLGFPPVAGSGCAKQPGKFDKQACLDALQTIAIYLEAVRRTLDTKPL